MWLYRPDPDFLFMCFLGVSRDIQLPIKENILKHWYGMKQVYSRREKQIPFGPVVGMIISLRQMDRDTFFFFVLNSLKCNITNMEFNIFIYCNVLAQIRFLVRMLTVNNCKYLNQYEKQYFYLLKAEYLLLLNIKLLHNHTI